MAQLQEPRYQDQAQSSSMQPPNLGHEKFMDEVAPNIWLGSKKAAEEDNLPLLSKHHIKGVVSLGACGPNWQFRKDPEHKILEIADSPYAFITDLFSEAFKFMDRILKNPNHSVLVHCEQGRSRSGAMVIAYLMKKHKQSYPETLNKVLVHRKRVMPNIGFQIQLRAFGKYKWDTSLKYSDKAIDIKKEILTALKNLSQQVGRLQQDIRSSEKIFVTFYPDEDSPRLVRIGLGNDDLSQYRKEWVLLVFLCHQFQLYEIAVNNSIITILHILGEMYFDDLVKTFMEVFEPIHQQKDQKKL